jgi:hypothetical protein
VDHLVDLDALALRLLPDLDRWRQSASVGPLTWRDEEAAWPQPIVSDRSAVRVPESLGVQLSRGDDEFEFIVWTGGWADVGSLVGGVPEMTAPRFVDERAAHALITALVEDFLQTGAERTMTSSADDAWPELSALIEAAPDARIVAGGSVDDLTHLGLTRRSYLGVIVANTGGLTIEHGWLRFLGGPGGELPTLARTNTASSGLCVFGFDVLGGVFALDGGSLGSGDGAVHYFAPDTRSWQGFDVSHSAFVTAMLSGAAAQFFEPFRWAGWEAEVAALGPDQGLSLWPPLWSREGKDLSTSSRRPVPLAELADPYWPLPTTR